MIKSIYFSFDAILQEKGDSVSKKKESTNIKGVIDEKEGREADEEAIKLLDDDDDKSDNEKKSTEEQDKERYDEGVAEQMEDKEEQQEDEKEENNVESLLLRRVNVYLLINISTYFYEILL